jgi:site-specific recombinase
MLRSGAGAGLIIAVMAWIKIQIEAMGLGEGATTLWVSLNYGLGFVLIHILHFTVATKQPAMTAARLAAAIEESEKGTANPAKLADLLVQVGGHSSSPSWAMSAWRSRWPRVWAGSTN